MITRWYMEDMEDLAYDDSGEGAALWGDPAQLAYEVASLPAQQRLQFERELARITKQQGNG